jgi:hypothetical protein
MPRRGQIFTPRTVTVIQRLADQGRAASEIAAAIGSTPASVRVRCSQLKIRLIRRGRPSRQEMKANGSGERKLIVYARQEAYAALQREAAKMHKPPTELARMLLEAIADSDLFGAVLDDRR